MPELILYPRGFMRAPGQTTNLTGQVSIEKHEGDKEIEALYTMFINNTVKSTNLDFRLMMVGAAARLFGNFEHFVWLQAAKNDCLYGLNYEFLVDTIRFINSGERQMDIRTWYELVLEYPEIGRNVASTKRSSELCSMLCVDGPGVIPAWCSQNGGFSDLAMSLNIMFGKAKIPKRAAA